MKRTVARAGSVAVLLGVGLIGSIEGQIRGRVDAPARRQRRLPAVSLLAGPSPYDLAGTGTGFAAGLRFDLPSGRKFVVEPGIGFLRYTSLSNARISYLLPEVSFQYQPAGGAARPYLGAGLGLAEFASGPSGSRGTVHAVAGLRLRLAGRFGLRGEGRYRVYDPLASTGGRGTMLDLGFGGSWTLGR